MNGKIKGFVVKNVNILIGKEVEVDKVAIK